MRIQLQTTGKVQCSRCLYGNSHPFGITFVDTTCSGCITHNEKNTLDWHVRGEILQNILGQNQRKRKSYYDCVVPVQGDAEDYFVISKVLALGLNPLITCVNDYFKNDIGWHNFHNLITYFDLDSLVYNPDIITYKEMVRTSLRKFSHVLWPSISLSSSFPVHIAARRNIPLVIWGQNQSVEQVGKHSHLDNVKMSKWSRYEHDLFGCGLNDVIGSGAQVDVRKLNYYRYPDIKKLGRGKVEGLYLSNFFRWDPLVQNQQSVSQGLIAQKNSASFDVYERAGSSIYYQLHDLLKLKRVGYRKITDHLSREIRHGRIDRPSAAKLEKAYSTNQISIDGFFKWLDVSKSGKEWFVLKRLDGFQHLVGEEKIEEVNLPEAISEYLDDGQRAARNYVIFEKGITL